MVEIELEAVLRKCSFHVLLLCIERLLSREGFHDVQTLGRRTTRQKSYLKGCDLLAYEQVGNFRTTTIVKVLNDDVRVRMLDELAGAMHRLKADFGIIVATGEIAAEVKEHAAGYERIRLKVQSGRDLARSLAKHEIAVTKTPTGSKVDYQFIEGMHEASGRLLKFLEGPGKEVK